MEEPPAARDAARDGVEEFVAVGWQAICISNDPQSPERVERRCAAEQLRIGVSVERHAHAGERRQVVDPPAGRGEVEVEQPDGDLVAVDEVLDAHVVVADHHVAACGDVGIGHLGAPRQPVCVEADGGVVDPAE